MMSYAAVNYAYFALAMSYDRQQARELRYGAKTVNKSYDGLSPVSGYGSTSKTDYRDSFQTMRTDLDKLFPERLTHHGQHHVVSEKGDAAEADFDAVKRDKSADNVSEASDASQVLLGEEGGMDYFHHCLHQLSHKYIQVSKTRIHYKTIDLSIKYLILVERHGLVICALDLKS